MRQKLTLCLKNIFPAAQALNVGISDIGNDSHVRLDNLCQIVNLPGLVHAHFQDTNLMLPGEPQQGKGQSHIVVEVPFSLQHLILCTQYSGHHILCGCLANTAGNGYKWDIKSSLVPCRQITQGLLGIGNLDIELSRQIILSFPGCNTAHCPSLQRGINVGVPVKSLADQRDKQGSLMDIPAVCIYTLDQGLPVLKFTQQRSTHCLQQLAQSDGFHHIPSFLASRDLWIMISHNEG